MIQKRLSIKYFPLLNEDKWKGDFLTELIDIRENSLELRGFTRDEVNELIDTICTS